MPWHRMSLSTPRLKRASNDNNQPDFRKETAVNDGSTYNPLDIKAFEKELERYRKQNKKNLHDIYQNSAQATKTLFTKTYGFFLCI